MHSVKRNIASIRKIWHDGRVMAYLNTSALIPGEPGMRTDTTLSSSIIFVISLPFKAIIIYPAITALYKKLQGSMEH